MVSAVSNLLANTPLEKAVYDQLVRLGPPPFDEADRAEAAKFQSTLTDEDVASAFRRVGLPMRQGVSLCDQIVPLDAKSAPMVGSTDVGDVSWVVPTVQARGATYAIGTPGHSWQLTAQGKLPAAHKGLFHSAFPLSRLSYGRLFGVSFEGVLQALEIARRIRRDRQQFREAGLPLKNEGF